MQRNALVLGLLLLLGPARAEMPPKPVFSFADHAGIVFSQSGKICLEIHNAALVPGGNVDLVFPAVPQQLAQARVAGKAGGSCPSVDESDPALERYELRPLPGQPNAPAWRRPAIALYDFSGSSGSLSGSFSKSGKFIVANPPSGSEKFFFRFCASSEGLHFTIWTGRPFTGPRLWHQYYYLGYDATPDCTDQDV